MGILITIGVTIVCVLTGSIIMIVTRRFRKTGLSVFGIIIFTLIVTCLWLFIPRHYDRNYLQKSSQWKNLTLRMYADSIGFYIGAIPGGIEISDPIFCKNFNSVTAENALKMGPLLRDLKTGDYDFSRADKIVDEAIEKNMRVRGHYDYSLSALELEYRELVARALIASGDFWNANFYLRFWAYSLSRCPVVLEEARRGRNPSFYVPFEPFKQSVLAACPEILDDMTTILGGGATVLDVERAVKGTVLFKELAMDQIRAKGISLE